MQRLASLWNHHLGLCLLPVALAACSDPVAPPDAVMNSALVAAAKEGGYDVTDLGTLGGATSVANAINKKGQVVGSSKTAAGHEHAFLWQDGVMTDLGTLGGVTSNAFGINKHGQVVGFSLDATGARHPFIWESGVMTRIDLPGGCSTRRGGVDCGFALDITDKGQVVGTNRLATENSVGFLWEDGETTDLPMTNALAVNNRGQVVGGGASAVGRTPSCGTTGS